MHTHLEWRKYKYFPYERRFAHREAQSLFGVEPEETPSGLKVPTAAFDPDKAEHLTYFARVIPAEGPAVVPRQARLEGSSTSGKRVRQSTRYSAHGLHEYKGKFNPQVVRAIGNMLGLRQGAWVLDPFSGSGTTLLECAHVGWNALGFDLNPLAVKVANAKLSALRLGDGRLSSTAEALRPELALAVESLGGEDEVDEDQLRQLLGNNWAAELAGREYLEKWFPMPVLAQIVAFQRAIKAVAPDSETRSVFEVLLSNQLREASLQEPADLRVRRRKDPNPNYPLLSRFLKTVGDQVPRIERARRELGCAPTGLQCACLADIRTDSEIVRQMRPAEGFDAVITSPPYATALPYIDTQRLSLVALGLVDAAELRSTETSLIGAREVGTRERRELEAALASEEANVWLPPSVLDLCQELLEASKLPGNGFRRRNKPALVFRYFRDMAKFFANVRPHMKPGTPIALVVGTNRTTLGGREFVLDTPGLLAAVAAHQGYTECRTEPMDTYPRYDLHQKNSINEESLVVVNTPAA